MQLVKITRAELPKWHQQLVALEQLSTYPLGSDTFRLSHGDDYFAFFERLGAVHYYAWQDRGQLVCVACGVLRDGPAGQPKRWYLADLKVHPDYRRRHLPIKMLRRAFVPNWLKCGRGYAIAMNPNDGREPPGLRLLAHFRWIPASLFHTQQLDIWSADADTMARALPVVVAARAVGSGDAHFASLRGVKDLVLASTHAPLALLHLRFGDVVDKATFSAPQPGHVHMWCAPRTSPTAHALVSAGFLPSASATLMQHRLAGFDWSTVDTSEI